MSARRSGWPAALLLLALFALLVLPVILSGRGGTSEAYDQEKHHLPTIQAIAADWPRIDVRSAERYRTATTPGYHVALALLVRYGGAERLALQLASSLFTAALLLVLLRQAAPALGSWPAAAAILPFAMSSYVLGGAIWLVTDGAALLFVALAAGGAVLGAPTSGRLAACALASSAAVLVRQLHVWTAVPLALAAALGGRWRALPLVLLPLAVVAAFALAWGGLTPPAFADQHGGGVNFGVWPLSLAIMGVFGIFFVPAAGAVRFDRWLWMGAGAAMLTAALVPSSYDRAAGRWGGAFWEVARLGPSVGDRSLALVALAAAGGAVVVALARGALRAGRRREALILGAGAAAWLAAQAASALAFQRYCEPVILLLLLWLAALCPAPPRRWWAGPLALGLIQLGLSGVSLYRVAFSTALAP